LLCDPERARRLGDAGRRAVLERYTWAGEGARLMALYHELLARAAGRGRSRRPGRAATR